MRKTAPYPEQQWTVMDLIKWGTEFFTKKNVDSPRLSIEMLICSVLNIGRLKLYTDFERPLTGNELAELKSMVRRRSIGEPLQYVLGFADFYGNRIEVTPDVLIPRPETELIVERIIKYVGVEPGPLSCADIGTGSGCIPIAIAHRCKQTTWMAVDKEPQALAIAMRNIVRHKLESQITCSRLDFLHDDIVERFDFITMNPPYISQHDIIDLQHEVRDYEPHSALTDDGDGMAFYRRMALLLSSIITSNGKCVMEVGHGQASEVIGLFDRQAYNCSIINDLQDIPRIVVVSLV